MTSNNRPAGAPKYLTQYKTPYEIRTRLLELAQEYLQSQYELNLAIARATFDAMVRSGYASQAEWEKNLPKMYDFSQIVEHAKTLQEFVDNKND